MSYLIKVSQATQIQVKVNGKTKAKTLMPDDKYIVDDTKNVQISDMKKVSCLKLRTATLKDESCFEHIELA